ncbi:hypothetical protein OIO90_003343 [Microbotryomycetes sp. JL221]|nr:hypothetical protein OIO90_003343 [Microbotryomycetes sp. JL221]
MSSESPRPVTADGPQNGDEGGCAVQAATNKPTVTTSAVQQQGVTTSAPFLTSSTTFLYDPPTPKSNSAAAGVMHSTPVVPTPAGLARELWDICERFATVTDSAERIGTDDVWAEINGAFSAMSLQHMSGVDKSPTALASSKKMENWIADQLQQKRRAQLDDLITARSTTPVPPPPPHSGSDGSASLTFSFHAPSASNAHFGHSHHAQHILNNMMQHSPGTPFSPSAQSSMDTVHSQPMHHHSPSNSMDSPLLTSTAYPTVPSPFLAPMQFGAANSIPSMYFPPSVTASTSMPNLSISMPEAQLAAAAAAAAAASLPSPSNFGDLELDHRWASALVDLANMQQQQQQNSGLTLAGGNQPHDLHRNSVPMLPRLITTDLSPGGSHAFTASPTINISRSPTPEPPSDHTRTRSLSASGPSTPSRTKGGQHHRRLSSGGGSPRYHPFHTSPKSSVPDPSLLAPDAAADANLLNPSSLISELALASPSSPASSVGGTSTGGGRRRSRSSEPRSRSTRSLAYDENAVFLKNEQHVFVLHTQTRYKPEITEQDVVELDLDPDSTCHDPSSALWRAVHDDEPYTAETLIEDCEREAEYGFVSTRSGVTTRWIVKFSVDATTDEDSPQPRTEIKPSHPPLQPPSVNPTYTFVHFAPGTIVVNPTYPIGSSKWWRVQECDVKHEHCPGDGSWTARWDEEGEERRPSRVVQHYASCTLRKNQGDFFALGKLARAVRTTKKRSEVLRSY